MRARPEHQPASMSGETAARGHVRRCQTDAMTSITVPPTQVLDKPGTIRWAVGSEAGPRSMAWNVVGHTTANDVFIGLRERMHEIKLSLHSAKWRMAYTESGRKLHLPDGADRVLTRW